MLVINPDDREFYARQFNIVLNPHAPTLSVWANNAGDALGEAFDYCEAQGWDGYFMSADEVFEVIAEFGEEVDIIRAGNASRPMESFYISIVDVTGDDWD